MRVVLGEEVPEPSEAELKAYLAANRERYRGPPTVTLDHVFYADPGGVPDKLLAQLQTGLPIDGLGDSHSLLGDAPARYTLRDLMGLLGPELAQRVFESAGRRVARPPAVGARRAFHPRRAAPFPEPAELRGARELSAPGLDHGPAAARDRRQAR